MPSSKKKTPQGKKHASKPRGSTIKKKKVEDKAWKSSVKVDVKGTPENSRSGTPNSHDNINTSRSNSMTSRDFIRQVLEFDKASESELESGASEDDEEVTGSTDADLKKALQASLKNQVNNSGDDNTPGISDSEDVAVGDGMNDIESIISDSNHSSIAIETDLSVYAPMPEFMPDNLPSLTLPPSSDDLLVSDKYIIKAVEIYEFLRIQSQVIRLSPFLFEEFLGSLGLGCDFEYNVLLHEIHCSLIKTILREEDNNQTSYGPVDVKDSMNSLLFFNDALTYPHIIHEYLRSEHKSEFKTALTAISDPEYPRMNLDNKLTVLGTLCNLILTSNSIREDLSAEGFIKYDDHCRVCQRTGDVLCCDTCSGVYHLYCVSPPLDKLPEGDWICGVCLDSEVTGVTDSVSSTEKRSMNRHDPLGFDRHRRKYWFLIRRILIEAEDGSVTYVTTEKQFEELMKALATQGDKWEKQLISTLQDRKEEITRGMRMTRLLTNEKRGSRQSYLDILDERIDKKREQDRLKAGGENGVIPKSETQTTKKPDVDTSNSKPEEDVNVEVVDEVGATERAESTASSETLSAKSDDNPSEKPTVKSGESKETEIPTVVGNPSEETKQGEIKSVNEVQKKTTKQPTIVKLDASGNITVVEQPEVGGVQSEESKVSVTVSETASAVASLTAEPASNQTVNSVPTVSGAPVNTEPEPAVTHYEELDEFEFTEELVGEEISIMADNASATPEVEENDDDDDDDDSLDDDSQDDDDDEIDDSVEDGVDGEQEFDQDDDMEQGLIDPVMAGGYALGDSDDGGIMDSDDEDGLDTSDLAADDDDSDDEDDYLGLAQNDSDDDDYSMHGDSDEGESSDGEMMQFHNQVDGADDSDDEDSPFIQPEPVIASVKPVTQISIPASQVLQPHVLKSLQALQSPSKQGGDGVSTQQQVIKLITGSGGQGDTIQISKGSTGQTVPISPAAGSNSKLNVIRLSPKTSQIVSGTTVTSAGQKISVLMPDQKLITTSTGQQLIVSSPASSSQNTVIGTTSGIKPINISKTYGRKVIAISSSQGSAAQQPNTVKLSTGQTVAVTPTTSAVSRKITLADMVGKEGIADKMVITSTSANPSITPKGVHGFTTKQGVIGNVMKSGGNMIKVVQGSSQNIVSGSNINQNNMVKIISNKTVQPTLTTGALHQKNIVVSSPAGMPLTLPDASPVAAQRLLLPSQPQKNVTNVLRTTDGRLINIQAVTKSPAVGAGTKPGAGTYMKIISASSTSGNVITSAPVLTTTSAVSAPNQTRIVQAPGNITAVQPQSQQPKIAIRPAFNTTQTVRNVTLTPRTVIPRGSAPRAITPRMVGMQLGVKAISAAPRQQLQTVVIMNQAGDRQTIKVNAADMARLTGKSAVGQPQVITMPLANKQIQPTTGSRIVALSASDLKLKGLKTTVMSADNSQRYVTRMKTGNLMPKTFGDSVTDLKGGVRMISSFKAEQELLYKQKKLEEKKSRGLMRNPDAPPRPLRQSIQVARPVPAPKPVAPVEPFKLGMEGGYKGYVNQYTDNPHALSKNQMQEEKDKKRHLSYKFSLTSVSDFKWHGAVYGSPAVILNTLRVTLKEFEEAIPLCFLHPQWTVYRAGWLKAITNCSRFEHFAFTLGVLQSNIKPVLFNAVWSDSLGHLSMIRQTAEDKEKIRKKEKLEKRQQDLLEQNQNLSKLTSIKYTKGLKHQIHKLKGEEFRLSDASGNAGWVWVRASRKTKSVHQDELGLRKCARNMKALYKDWLYKSESESETKTYGKAPAKPDNVIDMKEFRNKEIELADVSKGLAEHDIYPKCETAKSKLAPLLDKRILWEKLNLYMKQKAANKQVNGSPSKQSNTSLRPKSPTTPPPPKILQSVTVKRIPIKKSYTSDNEGMDVDVDVMNVSLDENITTDPEAMDTSEDMTPKTVTDLNQSPVKKEADNAGETNPTKSQSANQDGGCYYTKCYSPMCRSSDSQTISESLRCYSPLCPHKNTAARTPGGTQTAPKDEMERLKLALTSSGEVTIHTKTQDSVSLLEIFKVQSKAKEKMKGKPTKAKTDICYPHKYRVSKGKGCRASPFVLAKYELKPLSRKAGRFEVSGFNYNAKNAPSYWPYPCPRPRFRVGWEYRLFNNVTSIHGVANLLRVLWACIRWDDNSTKPPSGGANISTNDHDITTREILDKKSTGPFKLQTLYKVRTIVIPLNFMEQPTRTESNEPIREGLRKRKKHQVRQPTQPSTSVDWLPEEQLELWEINQFFEQSSVNKIEKREKTEKLTKKQAKLLAKEQQASSTTKLKALQKPMTAKEKEDVRIEVEEQLKIQRALANAKRQGHNVPTVPGLNDSPVQPVQTKVLRTEGEVSKKSIATLLSSGGNQISLDPNKLNKLPQYKMKDKEGKELTVRSLTSDQTLIKLPNGKLTVVTKSVAQKLLGKVQPVTLTLGKAGLTTISAATTVPSTSENSGGEVKSLTPSTIQASLMKAQTLSTSTGESSTPIPPECKVKTIFDKNYSGVPSISLPGVSLLTPKQELIQSTTPSDSTTATAAASASQSMSSTTLSVTSPAAMPTSPTAMLASPTALKAEDIDVKLERSEERKLSTSADNQTEEEADDDEGTTLSTEIMQQVVAQALSSAQAPEIQSRLQEMQKKLANVQGSITVTKQTPKSPEHLVSEYHEQMKSKPIKSKIFQPKVITEEELEIIKMKKKKNKEDYQKRKEKDRVKKLSVMLEKHTAQLKKEVTIKQEILKEKLKRELRDEIFAETGVVIPPDAEPSSRESDMFSAFDETSQHSNSSHPTPASTPVFNNSNRVARASTSQYAKKRKISLNQDDELKMDIKPAKSAKKTITKPKTLQNKLYCICHTPLDTSKFYVGCDICAQWFHGSCVGIREQDKDSVDTFVCDPCKEHQKQSDEELYCLCNKPYDDTQFYVGCDGCEGWFHPMCVGITQAEAEATDTYICPNCASKGSQTASTNIPIKGPISAALRKLVKALHSNEGAWPFLKPVDRVKVPDYYQVITHPMDLSTLANNLRANKYQTVGDFAKDTTKIFNNARYYNQKNSPVFLCAEKLEKFFVQRLKEVTAGH